MEAPPGPGPSSKPEELAEGQWSWNEPNPVQSRAVQAAAVQPYDRGVRVVTIGESHGVLSYARGRRIRLAR